MTYSNTARILARPVSLSLVVSMLFLAQCSSQSPVLLTPSLTTNHLYSSWSTLELDTLASAWLIKQFIDPEATFQFFPAGQSIEQGITFNVPDGQFTRTQKMTTYESILLWSNLQDARLESIAKIVHAVEIDYWIESTDPLVNEANMRIEGIIAEHSDPHDSLEKSFAYFNQLYQELEAS